MKKTLALTDPAAAANIVKLATAIGATTDELHGAIISGHRVHVDDSNLRVVFSCAGLASVVYYTAKSRCTVAGVFDHQKLSVDTVLALLSTRTSRVAEALS